MRSFNKKWVGIDFAAGIVLRKKEKSPEQVHYDAHRVKHDLSMEINTQLAFEEKLRPFSVDLLFIQRMPVNLKFNIINGIVIYSRDEEFRTDLEENIVRDYLDFKPVLEAYYREMAESILSGE
ncbi:MAG: hypothetical protein VR69_00540 [Peptococcaceae bacterium BRH_c4b]|nr:MAG: hypothetical protein VR69_00540 [Peptococcaceae bacterium BRH_c4b]